MHEAFITLIVMVMLLFFGILMPQQGEGQAYYLHRGLIFTPHTCPEFAGKYDFKDISMSSSIKAVFQPADQYEGVRRINIYLLRLVFVLMFFVLGRLTWTEILTHQGPWEPTDAVAWCVWTAFATLAGLGIIRPLKMLPILLLEIFYKVLWLIIVAYPLWSKGQLAGSAAEGTTSSFLWVILPIVALPWRYVFVNYIYKPKK